MFFWLFNLWHIKAHEGKAELIRDGNERLGVNKEGKIKKVWSAKK